MTVKTGAVTLDRRLVIADVLAVARDRASVLLDPYAAARLATGRRALEELARGDQAI